MCPSNLSDQRWGVFPAWGVKDGFTEEMATGEEVWGKGVFHPSARGPMCSKVWK